MEKKEGKFVLCDLDAFAARLGEEKVSREIRLIQNHHTWSPCLADFTGDNHFRLLKGMEHAHMERGFAEIAQNLTIFPDGTVAFCRSLDRIPAGIKGANTGGICIENVGNFDAGKDVMSEAQSTSIVRVNALLSARFGLTPDTDTVVYHHWWDLTTGKRTNGTGDTKTCPGTAFFGGNRVEDAMTHFIPLIEEALQDLAAPTPSPVTAALFRAEVIADTLNVRDQPGTNGKVVSRLHRGVMVAAYEKQGNWVRIQPDGAYWVNSSYIEAR